MRLIVYLFGKELLTISTETTPPEPAAPEAVFGPPFGFSGSGHGQVEQSYQDSGIIIGGRPT